MDAPAPARRRYWVLAALLAGAGLVTAAGALHVHGLVPAEVPSAQQPFHYQDYEKALRHVRPDGDVDFAALGQER